MLFDLEDYRGYKIIGPDHKPVEQINWLDLPYTTARATRDAYIKTINEYYSVSQVMATKEEMIVLNTKMNNILESNLVLGPLLRDFFNAMSSLAILPGQAINEGDRYKFIYVPTNDTSVDWFECTQPTAGTPISWNTYMSEGSKKVAVLDQEGDYDSDYHMYYKEMTQAFYDSYIAAFVDFQSKVKDLIITAEGGVENFHDYVAPAVPAWDSYPELSGYVRGTNNLTIKNAVVRLIDADGANHDLVTDVNGYYKFDKEMFYNNIAFDHGATASNFNMFVLEHTVGSTASLYDTTSIFQNSFFGAENNREFTWPTQVKMGKQARRNFKLEFKDDYSNYPSFSGYVKDVDGNPIKNAFVAIKDTVTGWSIGEYKKPSGNYGMKFTYDDFGTSRSVLTDANGYYEYTSQMVGEWFNKELISNGYIYIGSKMIGTSFDTYFVNPIYVGEDAFSAKRLETNTAFCAYLVPYIQDVNKDSISWDGVTIYDRNEYSTSRFKYALNSYNELFYQKIELNTHYNINVDVSVAVGNEVRAEKVFFKLDDRCKEVNGAFPIQLKVGFTGVMGRQYSQAFKIVYPKTGEYYILNCNWEREFTYDSNSHLNINYENFDDYSEFYLYSCDSYGRAVGVLNSINTFESNTVFESIDLSSLSNLTTLKLGERFYGDSIDLSEIDTLADFRSKSSFIKNIEGLGNQRDLSYIYIENALIETLDITNLKKLINLSLKKLTLLQSLDLQHNRLLTTLKIIDVDVELDVTGLSYLYNVSYDKLTLTSDDVDNLIIQIANNPSPYTDSTDWNFGHFIRHGNINFYDEDIYGSSRITRSSYSDIEFNILQTQGDFYNNSARCWSINLGGGFYPDLIEPKKLVLTVDPNLVDTYSEYLSTRPNVHTSTGYWIGKLWNGRIVGYLPIINLNGSSINETFRLGTENATIEIYSCDYYGIPQGEITSFELSNGFVFSDVDTSELTGLINLNLQGPGSMESLDLKSNINLETITLIHSATIDSIDVTGLTSLKNIDFANSSLSEVIGFSTLSSLETIAIQSLPNLSYLSFDGLNNIRSIYINEDDLYDSTHVDTMLSELNANSAAGVASLDAEIVVKQAELDAKTAEYDLAYAEFMRLHNVFASIGEQISILDTERTQLINDGADQSLIDAKQAEIEAKQVEENDALSARIEFQNTVYNVVGDEVSYLTVTLAELVQQRQNYFSGRQVNTYYMARTSASDADYDSLIAFGWTLNLGGEFIYPYSQPVKGFVTIDWNSNENSDDYYNFGQLFRFKSTTGYVKIKSGRYSEMVEVNSDNSTQTISNIDADMYAISFQAQKGIMEFYSCDSHGRPAGSIIGFGKNWNNSSFIKSFDISNLTDIDRLYFNSGFQSISTIDLSSNINIKSLNINQWNSLESIVGFENLVNLKDIYIVDCSSLDIPVDFTSMVDLQRIYLYHLGVNKNSRLNVSGLTKLQYIDVSWTNMLSVDLDNALLALDAAGLDSSFDFNYEGHLSQLTNILDLRFGMGIGYNPESASAFTSLQSKGWSLHVGDQIINSVEEPTKGIARWGMETGWAALYFYYKSGRQMRIKYPNGTIDYGSAMISFSFDSSMSEADRFVEFWAVDSYGRPRHDGITEVHNWWNTGVTSLEVNNITSITNINITNYKGTSLDVSGMTNLTDINLSNSYQLESLNVDGCSKIRNLNLDGCTNLDIDLTLESLDGTGSEGNDQFGNNYVNGYNLQRTHASDTATESLSNKRWIINIKEPAGTPVKFNITTDSYIYLGISTSTGNFKILWPTGTQEYNNYPDGQYFSGWQKYNSSTDFSYNWLSLGVSFNSSKKITIISCDNNQNPSGEVRAINMDCNRNYNFDYSTLSKLKVFEVQYPKNNTIGQLSLLNLAKLNLFYIDQNNYSSTTLDLSNVTTKSVQLVSCSSIQNVIFKSDVKGILIESCEYLTSLSLPSNLESLTIQGSPNLDIPNLPNGLKSLSFSNRSNLQTLSLPNGLTELTIYNCTNLTSIGSLPTSLKNVQLSNLPLDNQSLDFSVCTNVKNISVYSLPESLTTIDLTGIQTQQLSLNLGSTHISNFIGIETTKLYYFNDNSSFVNGAYTVVLPNTVTSFGISGMYNITSLDISVVNNEFLGNNCNISLQLNGTSLLTSIVSIPSAEYVYIYYPQGVAVAYSLPVFDERTRLYLNGFGGTSLDFGQRSLNRLELQSCPNLSTVTGLTGLAYLNISGCNSLNTDFSNFRITQEAYIQSCSNLRAIFNANYIGIYNSENVNISGSTITGNGTIRALYNGSLNFSNITANSVEAIYNGGSINLDNSHINDCFIRYNNSVNTITISNAIFDGNLIIDSCQNLQTIDLSTTSAVWLQIKSNPNLLNFSFSLKGTYAVYANSNFKLTNVTFTDAAISNSRYGVGPHYIDMHDNNLFTSATVDSIINAVSLSNATNKYLQLSKLNQRTSASQTAYNKLLSQNWNFINM